MEFVALPLIAEIGVALAGFATIAGVIQHDDLEADSIFDVVLHSLIAVTFSLIAILCVGAGGAGTLFLRILAAALLLASSLGIWRNVKFVRALLRDPANSGSGDGRGAVFGGAAFVCMAPSPLLSCAIIGGIFPTRAAFLFELAVLSHLLVAIFLLLYVVWRHFARDPGA